MMALSGCAQGLDTTYGHRQGASLNGTGVVATMFREAGHDVRTAVALSQELDDWADVIVRFGPRPGPPARDEADWYHNWLRHGRGRRLIYVPRDYDAEADYWSAVLDQLPKEAPGEQKERARTLRDRARSWPDDLPGPAKDVASPEDWFAVVIPRPNAATVCKTLGGPWAGGIDPAKAAIWRHQTLKVEAETVLLSGDDRPLAIQWGRSDGGRVLVLASGTFLLNAALANPARRPLAQRVVDWLDDDEGEGNGQESRNVAFVEGKLGERPGPRSIFALLRVPPFGWVTAQFLALGLAACLARACRLGRARPEPPSGVECPAAHPEALGALLARLGRPEHARALLDAYRQWRSRTPGRP
jgi:hypothetical protein